MSSSTFEKREAQSKIRYYGRIIILPQSRWPRAIMTMMETLDCKTATYTRKRVLELKKLYKCENIRIQLSVDGRPRLKKFNADIEKKVSEVTQDRLLNGMLRKKSLATYRMRGELNKPSCVYSNDRGSALLALARAACSRRGGTADTTDPGS